MTMSSNKDSIFLDYEPLSKHSKNSQTILYRHTLDLFKGVDELNPSQFIKSTQKPVSIKNNKLKPYRTTIQQPKYEKVPQKYSPYEEPFLSELKGIEPLYNSKKLFNGIVYPKSGGTYGLNSGYVSYKVCG